MKKTLIGKILIAICSLFLLLYLENRIVLENSLTTDIAVDSSIGKELPQYKTVQCGNNEKISQSFTPKYANLETIKVLMINISEDEKGTLVYQIEKQDGSIVFQNKMSLTDVTIGDWMLFDIKQRLNPNKTYILSFYTENANCNPIMLTANTSFCPPENQLGLEEDQNQALLVEYRYITSMSNWLRIFYSIALAIAEILLLCFLFADKFLTGLKQYVIKDNDLRKGFYYICMLILIGIAAFIHIYRLTDIPYGFHIDEIGMAYDAWCLSQYGVDRYLTSFPVYMTNLGTGQSALYAYLVAAGIKVFGYSRMIFRLPTLLNAFMICFFGLKIIELKWNTRKVKLLFMSLFTCLPIFLMVTRFGLDCYLMLGCTTLFIYTFLLAVIREKKRYYIISGLCGGVLLYSYAVSYVVLLLFLIFAGLYLIYIHKINWKNTIYFCISIGIVAMPLILVQIINIFDLPEIKIGMVTITKLSVYRGREISLHNFPMSFIDSLNSIFLDDCLTYNSFPNYFTMYWVSIPFVIVGLFDGIANAISNLKKKEWNISNIILIWFFAMLMIGSLIEGHPNANQLNGVFISCIFFLIEGILCVNKLLKNVSWRKPIFYLVALSYLLYFVHFTDYYYNYYKEDVYPEAMFEAGYEDTLAYMNEQLDTNEKNQTMYIDESNAIFFAGTVLPSPYDFPYSFHMEQYQNYVFSLPEAIDPNANYIVSDLNKKYAIELEKAGLRVKKIGSWYLGY